MKITLANPNQSPETYSYLEMLRKLQVGNLYLLNVAQSKSDPGIDCIIIKHTPTTASFVDATHGVGLRNLTDAQMNIYSNIRRVHIEEVNLKVIEIL